MKKIGIIDIGSNSITLVIYEAEKKNRYRIVDELKSSARLGDMNDTGNLKDERIDGAINTLRMYKNLCGSHGVIEIKATATEAVRKAKNRDYFIKKVQDEVGITIEVLSGMEEAFYDYFGVINTMSFKDGLLMDIGGASTEFALVENRQIKESISIPIGAINLTNKFSIKNKVSKNQEQAISNYVKEYLKDITWLRNIKVNTLIGIGGTIRNIGKINRKLTNYQLNIAHNYPMSSEEVKHIFNQVKTKTSAGRRRIKGLSENRADIFPAAVCAVCTVLDYCKLNDVLISGKGLRDGLIYEYICNGKTPVEDVLDFSLNNMVDKFNLNRVHSYKVYELTYKMVTELKELHGIGIDESYNNIIKTATILHNSGVNINFYGGYKHTFYALLNSGVNGLTHRELLLSAILAASFSHKEIKIGLSIYNKIIDKKDMDNIKKIAILLKIAHSLDRSGSGIVKDIVCKEMNDKVTIIVRTSYNVEFEINDAKTFNKEFKELYKKSLNIIK